jgi:hypothetical protein
MSRQLDLPNEALGDYFPLLLHRAQHDPVVASALAGGYTALDRGGLPLAMVNQALHLCAYAGMSEGFFRYYFLEAPHQHPYPVGMVLGPEFYEPPAGATQITNLQHLHWGVRRFMYDAMLYWGDLRQAYRELRSLSLEAITRLFAAKRFDPGYLMTRGSIMHPAPIAPAERYLVSEIACRVFEGKKSAEELDHVRIALDAFESLAGEGLPVPTLRLHERARKMAEQRSQLEMFDLLSEPPAGDHVRRREEVIAPYAHQWASFREAHARALHNTRLYLSVCNDLDVYVATSMRCREDFRDMVATCEQIFCSPALRKYNLRYFDATVSVSQHHEDKGIIECLVVKTAKLMLYLAQHKESLGKVSEYAMALSLGKPVIILCPKDERGKELHDFYLNRHPLARLIEFRTGIVNGAMITSEIGQVIQLIDRILSNQMEYDLCRKPGTQAFYLLRERLTQSTVRIATDDQLLSETFWNNYHNVS